MTFTRRAPDEPKASDLERISRDATRLQLELARVSSILRERGNEASRDVSNDIDALITSLSSFRSALDAERREHEQEGALSRDAQVALFELGKALTSSLDLETVLNQVMDFVIELTKAERGYLVLVNEKGQFDVQVARNLDQDTIRSMEFAYSSSVVEEVIRSERSVLTSNAQTDERFALQRSVAMFRLTSIMASPLRIRGKVIGVLYVDNRAFTGQFSQQKLDLLEAFAGQAAIAIHNAKLFGQTDEALKQRVLELESLYRELGVARERAEKGLAAVEREMQIGRVLQTEFLPRELPSLPGWQIAARFLPARQLSGDFYDVFRLSSGEVAVAIADVCDKGVGAALFMSLVRGLLRAFALRANNRQEALASITQTNDYLAENHGRTAMFTTLFFGVLEPESGELSYINCGHDAPLVLSATGEEKRLESSGPALGAIRDVDFEIGSVVLLPGDSLMAFTDGVSDALDAVERPFTEERFISIVRVESPSVTALLGDVVAALRSHIGNAAQYDDITMLALRRNPPRRDFPTGQYRVIEPSGQGPGRRNRR